MECFVDLLAECVRDAESHVVRGQATAPFARGGVVHQIPYGEARHAHFVAHGVAGHAEACASTTQARYAVGKWSEAHFFER